MRSHGTLIRWNDERGFGFIQPAGEAEALFVHVSAFPRDDMRPCVGEKVSFEIDTRSDGKTQAVRVMRPGSASASGEPRQEYRGWAAIAIKHRVAKGPWMVIGCLVVLLAVSVYAYVRHMANRSPSPLAQVAPVTTHEVSRVPMRSADQPSMPALMPAIRTPAATTDPAAPFHCDGRTMCSQMHSCEEATWVLNHCPGTRMDGDQDGVPCERQWCGG
jgi:cold shock CspA family protein